MSLRTAVATALALSVALVVAGCAQSAAPDATSSPAQTSTPTATPQPSATEFAPDPTATLTCDILLDAETRAKFGAGSLGLPTQDEIDSYVDKTRDEGNALALFADYGGVLCPVTNGTWVSEVYGFSPITPDHALEQQTRLAGEGLTVSDYAGGTLLSDLRDKEDVALEYLFLNGYWACAYDVMRLDEIVANAPVG
jgi:hypothetical protein